jgi:hypothetical protein
MAARARRSTSGDCGLQAGAAPRARSVRTATEDHAGAPSPALTLQQALATEILGVEEPRKWAPIATLGFIVATCGAFWAAVAFGVSRLS